MMKILMMLVLLAGTASGSMDYIDGLQDELICDQSDSCPVNETRAEDSDEYFQGMYDAQELSTGISGRPDAIKAIEEIEDEDPARYVLLMRLILNAYS